MFSCILATARKWHSEATTKATTWLLPEVIAYLRYCIFSFIPSLRYCVLYFRYCTVVLTGGRDVVNLQIMNIHSNHIATGYMYTYKVAIPLACIPCSSSIVSLMLGQFGSKPLHRYLALLLPGKVAS